jgi:hypothetical protein
VGFPVEASAIAFVVVSKFFTTLEGFLTSIHSAKSAGAQDHATSFAVAVAGHPHHLTVFPQELHGLVLLHVELLDQVGFPQVHSFPHDDQDQLPVFHEPLAHGFLIFLYRLRNSCQYDGLRSIARCFIGSPFIAGQDLIAFLNTVGASSKPIFAFFINDKISSSSSAESRLCNHTAKYFGFTQVIRSTIHHFVIYNNDLCKWGYFVIIFCALKTSIPIKRLTTNCSASFIDDNTVSHFFNALRTFHDALKRVFPGIK